MGKVLAVLLLVCCVVAFTDAADPKPSSGEKKVVCYFTNWSYKRPDQYSFTPDNIDPFLCTHIIYAFADIGFRNNLIASDPEFDFNQRGYANITALKKKNKNLKVMIGIGGWAKGTLGFGRITYNETNRKEFAKIAVRYIRGYMFDGLDLNWQHPTFREGGSPEDKQNYVLLAQTLREEFEKEAELKNKPRLLLSIAISHNEKFLPAYDIANFNNYVDFISVICYDYHFSYESAVNHHSPLYSLEEDSDYNYDSKNNINYTISFFSELADPEKLVLGIPTYGRTYKLENSEDTALGSYADGPGDKGPITGEKGWFAYFEICNFVKNEGWNLVQTKPGLAGPYAYKDNQWVCYDDLQMIRNKAAYAKEKGLGGIMFWTIDYDDFLGTCQETKFPLIRAARDELQSPGTSTSEDSEDSSEQSARTEIKPTPVPAIRQPSVPHQAPETPIAKKVPVHKPNCVKGKSMSAHNSGLPRPVSPQHDSPDLHEADVRQEPAAGSDVSVPQSNIVGELVHLIKKAGGVSNFCKIIRQDASHESMLFHKRSFKSKGDSENSIVLETPNISPILLVLSNSSIYIKEINIYHRPDN